MRLREYTITVQRVQEQTVTFVVDLDALPEPTPNDALTQVALAHCSAAGWEQAEMVRRGSLDSRTLEADTITINKETPS